MTRVYALPMSAPHERAEVQRAPAVPAEDGAEAQGQLHVAEAEGHGSDEEEEEVEAAEGERAVCRGTPLPRVLGYERDRTEEREGQAREREGQGVGQALRPEVHEGEQYAQGARSSQTASSGRKPVVRARVAQTRAVVVATVVVRGP